MHPIVTRVLICAVAVAFYVVAAQPWAKSAAVEIGVVAGILLGSLTPQAGKSKG